MNNVAINLILHAINTLFVNYLIATIDSLP